MPTATAPSVVDLADPVAADPGLTGGKAAALARAASAGLATLGGTVLTTAFCDAADDGLDIATSPAVREAFDRAGGGARQLVARSSSVIEDSAESSMAGQFESVIGWLYLTVIETLFVHHHHRHHGDCTLTTRAAAAQPPTRTASRAAGPRPVERGAVVLTLDTPGDP